MSPRDDDMMTHLVVQLQLFSSQVGGVGVVPRVGVRLEGGLAVDPDPPQRPAEQALRVRRQRRAVAAAPLRRAANAPATTGSVARLQLLARDGSALRAAGCNPARARLRRCCSGHYGTRSLFKITRGPS